MGWNSKPLQNSNGLELKATSKFKLLATPMQGQIRDSIRVTAYISRGSRQTSMVASAGETDRDLARRKQYYRVLIIIN
jgi:hypothetical protein